MPVFGSAHPASPARSIREKTATRPLAPRAINANRPHAHKSSSQMRASQYIGSTRAPAPSKRSPHRFPFEQASANFRSSTWREEGISALLARGPSFPPEDFIRRSFPVPTRRSPSVRDIHSLKVLCAFCSFRWLQYKPSEGAAWESAFFADQRRYRGRHDGLGCSPPGL